MNEVSDDKHYEKCLLMKVQNIPKLKQIFKNLNDSKLLKIIMYNRKLLQKLNKDVTDYKNEYSKIIIEIFPICDRSHKRQFINLFGGESYCHIYFDDNKEETKRNYLYPDEKVIKIKVILDYKFKSLCGLFKGCSNVRKIDFIRFDRENISNMSYMFYDCANLTELNLSNFNTNNVKDMSYMFFCCYELEELNLSNFNTNNVKDMSYIFFYCFSLKELNLSNFNTNNIKDMRDMFDDCSSLKSLNLCNLNEKSIKDINGIIGKCNSLKSLKKIIYPYKFK